MTTIEKNKTNIVDLVISAEGIDLNAIQALTRREALIVRIPNFIPASTCRLIANELQKEGYHDYAPSVGRIGMSYYETVGKQEIIDHYFQTALPNIHTLRNVCAPYQCPIDIFRCAMDEIWPAGANLQSLSGRKMFVGLSRKLPPRAPMSVHHDLFSRLAPNDPEANDLLLQMAVNVYIDVPEQGGELIMWRDQIPDQEFLKRRGDKYGIDIEEFGKPDIIVKPQVGDLILFDARKPHAVAGGSGSDRLSVSCFLGYRGEDRPLTFWS